MPTIMPGESETMTVYLSRRNLLTLLSKLDRAAWDEGIRPVPGRVLQQLWLLGVVQCDGSGDIPRTSGRWPIVRGRERWLMWPSKSRRLLGRAAAEQPRSQTGQLPHSEGRVAKCPQITRSAS